jgi:hypothetical protein
MPIFFSRNFSFLSSIFAIAFLATPTSTVTEPIEHNSNEPTSSEGRTVMRLAIIVLLTLSITGCVTYAPSVPDGYVGPQAVLADSAKTHSTSKADFFVAEKIDGADVDNSLNETFRRNQGRGMLMTPYFISRPLVAEKPVKVAVKGKTHYAAPIQAIIGTVRQVEGVVEFTPKANVRYIVRGELREGYSAVWIEETETRQLVGQKIEPQGAAVTPAAAASEKERLFVQTPAIFAPSVPIPADARGDCSIETLLGNYALSMIERRIGPAQLVTAPEQAGNGKLVQLTIISVQGHEGGVLSGSKSMSVRVDVRKGEATVGSTVLTRRFSGGGFKGVHGTCAGFDRVAGALGRDVAVWLSRESATQPAESNPKVAEPSGEHESPDTDDDG